VQIIVTILGHMLAAAASHTQTEEFGLGFGRTIWSRTWHGTVFKINALPILAYVKIKGMESNYDAPDGFYTKGWWARLFTMVGGMLGNWSWHSSFSASCSRRLETRAHPPRWAR